MSKNKFSKYGFKKPVFKAEILAEKDGYLFGYYKTRYKTVTHEQIIPCMWNSTTGTCCKGGGVSNSKYSLVLKGKR